MPCGSCWCGKVKYDFTGDASQVILCHCLTCQKTSGGPYSANITVPKEQVNITSGSPKMFTKKHETAGFDITVFYCGDCGTMLYKQGTAEGLEHLSFIRAGTLDTDEPKIGKPVQEFCIKYRMPWMEGVSGAAQMQEFS